MDDRRKLIEDYLNSDEYVNKMKQSANDPGEPARRERLDRSNLVADIGSALSGLVTAQGQAAGYRPDSKFYDSMKSQAIDQYQTDKQNKSNEVRAWLEGEKLRKEFQGRGIEQSRAEEGFNTDQAGKALNQTIAAAAEARNAALHPGQLTSQKLGNEGQETNNKAAKFNLNSAQVAWNSATDQDSDQTKLTRAALSEMTSDPTIKAQIQKANARELHTIADYLKSNKQFGIEEGKISAAQKPEPNKWYVKGWKLRPGLGLEGGEAKGLRELTATADSLIRDIGSLSNDVDSLGTFETLSPDHLSKVNQLLTQMAKFYGQGALQAPDKEVMQEMLAQNNRKTLLQSPESVKDTLKNLSDRIKSSHATHMDISGYDRDKNEPETGSNGKPAYGGVIDFRDLISPRK